MILPLVLILTAVATNGREIYQDGQRKSRQLDLGLQDINNSNEKIPPPNQLPLEALQNGYLPPVSSAQKVIPSPSQQSFDFKPANTVETELCKPPFDSILCNSKQSFTKSDDIIPKPSRDLVPPFNDLEQDTDVKTTLKQRNEETTKNFINSESDNFSVFSTVSHSSVVTTTRKPIIKTTKPQQIRQSRVQSITRGENLVASTKTSVINKAQATNELRSYLPPQPEYSAAAQTSVGVVRPAEQNNDDHHHHHHHHGDDFDICADAFHSFLCAPLKARKRITGALPNNLRGQSSFVQYQKVLPNADKEPASSNAFQNEYLPPRPTEPPSAPSNTFQNEYLPPRLTEPPSAPSNTFQNEYLPPRPSALPPVVSASNRIQSTYSPPSTTPKQIITTTTTTARPYSPPKVFSVPSNLNRIIVLDNSKQITQKLPSPSTIFPSTLNSYHFNEVKSVVPTVSPVSTTVFSTVIPAASFQREYSSTSNVILPVISTFSSQSSNEDRFYLPPHPNPQPAATFVSTTEKFFPQTSTFAPLPSSFSPVSKFVPVEPINNYLPPLPKFQPLPTVISTTRKVFPTVVRITPQPSTSTTFVTTAKPSTFYPLPSNPSGAYLPPQPKFQSASNLISTTIKPFTTTTRKPTTRKPTTTTTTTTEKFSKQPSDEDRSYLPPDPNVQPAAAQISAAAVAAPQTKNPFHHGRDLCTDPFHSFLCASAKPRKRITGALPSGFRPESSNTNELRVKPAASFQNENKIIPDKILATSQSESVGYNYPKPVKQFPEPSNVSPSTVAPSTGYSYPKPEKIFPLPSQQNLIKYTTVKPVTTKKPPAPVILRTSEARVVAGYEYPKPQNKLPLPTEQEVSRIPTTSKPPSTGYSYPKPQKPFPLPTEQKEIRYPSPRPPSTTTSSPSTAQPTNEVRGYQYPKPQQSFDLPEKKGYYYPRPERRLELPTESRPKSLLPQTNPNLDVLRNLGSAEFIPVNKLDKRNEPSNLSAENTKFGERLKKRERRPSD